MVDVFISYKRQERDRCERIAAKLKALDLDVWFDARLESGKSFDREIETAVNAAKAVLVLWSPLSVDSEWVRNEATIGQRRGVLAAAQITPCTLPINFTNTHFEELHAADFADDHPGWLKLLERIGKLAGRPGLAGYAAALAASAGPLAAWARQYPTDPLVRRARALAGATLAAEDAPAPKPKPPVGLIAGAAAAALLVGGGLGWGLKPAQPPSKVAKLSGVEAVPARVLSPTAEAAALVGAWYAGPGPHSCAARADLTFALTGAGLDVSGVTEVIVGSPEPGLIQTRGADGLTYAYRVDGDRLSLRAQGDAQALEYGRCG